MQFGPFPAAVRVVFSSRGLGRLDHRLHDLVATLARARIQHAFLAQPEPLSGAGVPWGIFSRVRPSMERYANWNQ